MNSDPRSAGSNLTTGGTGPHSGQPVAQAGAPLGEGRAAMIKIHGRNAGPHNILDLFRMLDRPDFTYLAPAARNNAWYPNSFMAERESNQPGISSGLSMIGALVDDVVKAGVPRERIMLLGFSQGACLTSEFAYRHPTRYGGVIVYSGGLIGPPETRWEILGSLEGTPVFLGCSDQDPHIPEDRVHDTAQIFEAMEAQVTERIYPGMGHLVNDDEIAFTQELMDQVLSA